MAYITGVIVSYLERIFTEVSFSRKKVFKLARLGGIETLNFGKENFLFLKRELIGGLGFLVILGNTAYAIPDYTSTVVSDVIESNQEIDVTGQSGIWAKSGTTIDGVSELPHSVMIHLSNANGPTIAGVLAEGNGKVLFGNDTQIVVEGEKARGIRTNGNASSSGLIQLGKNTEIIVTSSITGASGSGDARGVYAYKNSATDQSSDIILGSRTRVEVDGESISYGLAVENGTIKVEDSGVSGEKIWIQAIGKASVVAVRSTSGGTIDLGREATVLASGGTSVLGIYANDRGSVTAGEKLLLSVEGANAKGIIATGRGNISLAGGTIQASGVGSSALFADNTYASGTASQINGNGTFKLLGDVSANRNSEIGMTFSEGSFISGATQITGAGKINYDLTDSDWNVTGDSALTTLTMASSNIHFSGTNFSKLEAGTWSGDGTITMRADLTSDPAMVAHDQLTGSGTGNFFVNVQQTGGSNINTQGEYLLGQFTATGPSLQLKNLVDAGAYQFNLRQDFSGGNINYLLFYNGTYSNVARIAPNSSRSAYWLDLVEANSFRDRMGLLDQDRDEHGIGVWAQTLNGKTQAKKIGPFESFSQEYGGLRVGLDFKRELTKGEIRWGALFGHTHSTSSYFDENTTNIDSYYGGLYGTYFDKDRDFYIDVLMKASRLNHEAEISVNQEFYRGKDRSSNFGTSIEVGKKIFLTPSQSTKGRWYLEPRGKFAFTQIGSTSYSINNISVETSGINSLVGEGGFFFGYEIQAGKAPMNFYSKVAWAREFNGKMTSQVGNALLESSLQNNWWTYGVGATANIDQKHTLYFDLEKGQGTTFKQNWKFLGGYRYQW